MSSKKRYRDLMERIRQFHQEFTEVWSRVRTAELHRHNIILHDNHWANDQMEKIWEANGVAYKAAQPQADKRNEFSSILYDELPFEEFLQGNPEAIDSILDFLEIDVLAFRCGYVKQWCFHKLKSLELNEKQIIRLRQLTLAMCQFKGQRKELRELTRLMIKLADNSLIEDLQRLARTSDNKYVKQKAERVLGVISNSRHG